MVNSGPALSGPARTRMELSHTNLGFVYFIYGLAFFCMGLAITLEHARGSDVRLRLALRPLAAFGFIHGIHEWIEMGVHWAALPNAGVAGLVWQGIRLALLAFSFLSLGAFGFSLLTPNLRLRRLSLLAPLLLAALWGFGLLSMLNQYTVLEGLWHVADVWTRYTLGIPASLAASIGLVVQQRAFRLAGMERFGRDSLFASLAFAWYGLVGQLFTIQSRLFPSTHVNQDLFFHWLGFPIQLMRAALAVIITIFVIRFMRAFDAEIERQIRELQQSQLAEAQQREALRGEQLKRIVAAQEAERQRVARELHDDTGQSLTAIGLGLRGVANSLHTDPRAAEKNLGRLQVLANQSLEELQRMIRNLRPSHLDDLGLPAALRWYGGEAAAATNLRFHFEMQGEERPLPEPLKVALYRIAQEALTNVIKHARAQNAWLQLSFLPQQVEISLRDDGRGFDTAALGANRSASWGLLGMHERAALLGGRFQLSSVPGHGTLVAVTIPCPETVLSQEPTHEHPYPVGG
ncbi:MAG: sensor histidine kinase [Chloroflexi bacterium]|nr:sensor histidine kinase [Chloroflexota bacterium]